VRGAFPDATLFRPSAMFGPDDALLTALIGSTLMPAIPLFARGATRLQPVSVEDVAEAAARVLLDLPDPAPLYELGGPGIFTYRELVGLALRVTGRHRPLVPVPFAAWDAIAAAAGLLPSPPVTEGMVALMRRDNVADPRLPGLAALGVTPRPLQAELDRRRAAR
jgi:NADH dehydrogenase